MKKLIISFTLLICPIIIFSYSCESDNNIHTDTPTSLQSIEGHWFFQPTNRELALSMVNTKNVISINFLDSVYCNVEINGIGGDVILSRRYKIDSNLVLEDPTQNKTTTYRIKMDMRDSTFKVLNTHGEQLFKAYPYNYKTRNLLNSDNILQKQEFLYPVLSSSEQQGVHFVEIDGRLQKIDPAKGDSSKINIYKIF